ncbi:alpha/beta hydrolase family protein [Fundicoccus sp. Sow4_H7]|uniref:alpha/beta hydrolase family protein n=1 Tax=Fundicoccus sp. Sow4_H7 TaxID=3438784 RepID=UPI003F91DD44
MKRITKESLFDLKSINQLAQCYYRSYFTQTEMNQKKNRYETSLQSIDLKTKEIRQWFSKTSTIHSITVAPNLGKLIFIASENFEAKPQIFTIPLDGGSAVALTDEKEGVSSYYWIPNTEILYYQTSEKESKEEKEKYPQPISISRLTYKADGGGFIDYNKKHLIRKINIRDGQADTVMTSDESFSLSYVQKDENYLLFNSAKDPEDEWAYGQKVYRFDLATQETTAFFDGKYTGFYYFAAANEAEDALVFYGNEFDYQFVTLTDIYLYEVETGELKALTADLDIEIGDAFVGDFQQNAKGIGVLWLDNERFVFDSSEKGQSKLYIGQRDGDINLLFDQPLHLTSAALNIAKDQLTVSYSTPTEPSALAHIPINTAEFTPFYQPNQSFMEAHQVVDPERFWYKGYDDWDIQGWYLAPIEAKASHPAILYIHGGPQVAYGETFFHEMQWLAAEGYGVIMLNPRGGNSYGQEFVASILGDYGNHDFDDLMLGVDAVLANHPEIDADQLFVAGGSYGGFMTNWIVTHTDRFKAAVSQRSISNWISFYGVSDIGAFFTEFQLQNDLTNYQRLWEMSPIAHAANAKTPILLLHGQDDLRCPQEQAEQMYVAMKKNGVETKLILFPQSSHGLSRNGLPNLRLERLQAILDWFNAHSNK